MRVGSRTRFSILALMALAGFWALAALNLHVARSSVHAAETVRETSDSALLVKDQRLILANVMKLTGTAAIGDDRTYSPKPLAEAISQHFSALRESQEELQSVAERSGSAPEQFAQYSRAQAKLAELIEVQFVVALQNSAPQDALTGLISDATAFADSMDIFLSGLEEALAAEQTFETDLVAAIAYQSAYTVIVASTALSVLILLMALLLGRAAGEPLAQATEALNRLAEKDVGEEVEGGGRNMEIRALAEAVGRLNQTLSGDRRR